MADDAELMVELKLVPMEQPADSLVLDDIVCLIRQAIATAPENAPKVATPIQGFRDFTDECRATLLDFESRTVERIREASTNSRLAVESRKLRVDLPGAKQMLAEDSLTAAANLVSAVQGAIYRRVSVRAADNEV